MNRAYIVIIILAIATLSAWVLFSINSSPDSMSDLKSSKSESFECNIDNREAETIFDLKFCTYDGDVVSLNDFKEVPLVVNSWAKWCPFCIEELPDFVTIQNEFSDQTVFIAIDRAESRDLAKAFTDDLAVTNALKFWLDPGDDFYRMIGGFSMPETLFIKADGIIDSHKRGVMDLTEIREKTISILK